MILFFSKGIWNFLEPAVTRKEAGGTSRAGAVSVTSVEGKRANRSALGLMTERKIGDVPRGYGWSQRSINLASFWG